jgi:hypothetical protein
MVEITDRVRSNADASEIRTLAPTTSSHVDTVLTPKVGLRKKLGHFVLHYFEMCLPMCIGFAAGDLVYFWAAGRFGYSHPFSQLPELSALLVSFTMTAPMTAWMLFRGMPRRATAEMSAAMPLLALVLLALGWLAILAKSNLVLLEHGLMMPIMLIPMLFRLDVYTGRAGHTMRKRIRRPSSGRGRRYGQSFHRSRAPRDRAVTPHRPKEF